MSEQIEWLDFESDDALIDNLRQKIKNAGKREQEVKRYLEMSSTDLSKDGMKNLYEDGSKLIMKIQSSMLKFGEQIAEIRKKYDEARFNFDKENDRIKLKLMGKEDKMLSFDKNLQEYREVISKIGELLNFSDSKFNKISKSELYTFHESLAKGVAQMVIDLMELENTHIERLKLFDEQFDKLTERQLQKEYRKKLREAAKEAERKAANENKKDEDDDTEESEISSPTQIASNTVHENASETHDEVPLGEVDGDDVKIAHDEL